MIESNKKNSTTMYRLITRLRWLFFPKQRYKIEYEQREEYMMLDRLKMDCDYYLGCGNRYTGHLWATSEEEQIAYMKRLYKELLIKPKWISMRDIKRYEKQMCNGTIVKF